VREGRELFENYDVFIENHCCSGEAGLLMTTSLFSPEQKQITVTVISDLATDARVHKVCQTLHNEGFRILLIGTRQKQSLPLKARDYQTDRIKMWFRRTALFYAEFNIRLFFRLYANRADIYLGNDLDVMPATMLVARLRKKPLVYDSHEYFLGVAGMEQKPLRRSIWKMIENRVFSRLTHIYTVSESIRDLYSDTYHKKLSVVRNLPLLYPIVPDFTPQESQWIRSIDLKIPENKNLLIFQGAGINMSRGAEELVQSMIFLDAADFHLLIVGGGDVFGKLEKMIGFHQLSEKITLVPKIPFAVLSHFTRKAQLGLSIDKPFVLNHKFSLPNKLFEYLHAGVPVLASRLVEQEKIINRYDVGTFIEHHEPEHIAGKIKEIFGNPELLKRWKENTRRVREELNWENESKIITYIFKQVDSDSVNN
jgi:glycosyltransferase involved in cell wall biosynthesis